MLVGCQQALWLRLIRRLGRRRGEMETDSLVLDGRTEGEMAVVAFVEGLDQVQSGSRQRRGDLGVSHARAPHDVDRLAEQMIAVGDAAYRAIVLD